MESNRLFSPIVSIVSLLCDALCTISILLFYQNDYLLFHGSLNVLRINVVHDKNWNQDSIRGTATGIDKI
uniref:Uncharacterized protein n=1 Tax=Anguilla anguilla TaxID=7936 RepID=A0A0E9X3S3_ANGAN